MLVDVLHHGLTVSNIERSIAWYADVLGLELVYRQRQDNSYTRQLVGMPDAVLESAMLKVPGLEHATRRTCLSLLSTSRLEAVKWL
jgi:catechol 2,3-dioxygenase-like lactoylglutathione lyase family enzyme